MKSFEEFSKDIAEPISNCYVKDFIKILLLVLNGDSNRGVLNCCREFTTKDIEDLKVILRSRSEIESMYNSTEAYSVYDLEGVIYAYTERRIYYGTLIRINDAMSNCSFANNIGYFAEAVKDRYNDAFTESSDNLGYLYNAMIYLYYGIHSTNDLYLIKGVNMLCAATIHKKVFIRQLREMESSGYISPIGIFRKQYSVLGDRVNRIATIHLLSCDSVPVFNSKFSILKEIYEEYIKSNNKRDI